MGEGDGRVACGSQSGSCEMWVTKVGVSKWGRTMCGSQSGSRDTWVTKWVVSRVRRSWHDAPEEKGVTCGSQDALEVGRVTK